MESLKRSLKYQWLESKSFILRFWIVLIIVDISFYFLNTLGSNDGIVGFSLGNSELSNAFSVVGVNFMIIIITFIVYNYERNYESFPLSLSMGMTRKDYFLSFFIDNLFIVFIFSLIQTILLKIDPIIIKSIGKEPLYDFVIFNLNKDNIFFIIFSIFILFLFFISLFNLLASLNYKFGYKLWIVIVGFNILLSILNRGILGEFTDKIFEFVERFLVGRLGLIEVLVILGAVALLYILNYLITINTHIKKKTI